MEDRSDLPGADPIATYNNLLTALDAYMDKRKAQGIGHVSKEGNALHDAYVAYRELIPRD
jgi:hypothetical protein